MLRVFLHLFIFLLFFSFSAKADRTALWFVSSDKNNGKSVNYLLSRIKNNLNYGYGTGDFIISVTNNGTTEVCGAQIRIEAQSIINSIGNHFRIVAPTGILPYCFEQTNEECSTNPSNVIWVKLPCISSNATISLYVQQTSSLGATDGKNVFLFYEDFNSPLDASIWLTFEPQHVYTQNGYLIMVSNSGIVSRYSFDSKDTIIESRAINVYKCRYESLLGITSETDLTPCTSGTWGDAYNVDFVCNTSAGIYTGNTLLSSGACWGEDCPGDDRGGIPPTSVYNGEYADSVFKIVVANDYRVFFYQRTLNSNSFSYMREAHLASDRANSMHVYFGSGPYCSSPEYNKIDWVRVRKTNNITYNISEL